MDVLPVEDWQREERAGHSNPDIDATAVAPQSATMWRQRRDGCSKTKCCGRFHDQTTCAPPISCDSGRRAERRLGVRTCGRMSVLVIGPLLALALALASAAAAAAATPSREDLQRAMTQLQEVTYQYFDHPRSLKVRAFIDDGHARILELARGAPEARRIAQVIFSRGADSKRVQAMAKEFHLSVHEVGLVFALEGEREFANSLPSQLLWGSRAGLSEVIDRYVADHRVAFEQRATRMREDPNPNAAAGAGYYAAMAKSGRPLLVRLRVTASADMLRLVSEESDVYAVVLNPSAESARRLDETRAQVESPTSIQDVTDPPPTLQVTPSSRPPRVTRRARR
jgi:hypothetical protein